MSNYNDLFKNILDSFLNDDFVKKAKELFDSNYEEQCQCGENKKNCDSHEKKNYSKPMCKCENAPTYMNTFVRSEFSKTTDKGFEFKLFIPGVKKDNISINIEQYADKDVMKIKLVNMSDKGAHPELLNSGYEKKINFAKNMFDYNNITAKYNENILCMFVPYKVKETKSFEIKIN